MRPRLVCTCIISSCHNGCCDSVHNTFIMSSGSVWIMNCQIIRIHKTGSSLTIIPKRVLKYSSRSEERRVGKECRSWCLGYDEKTLHVNDDHVSANRSS